MAQPQKIRSITSETFPWLAAIAWKSAATALFLCVALFLSACRGTGDRFAAETPVCEPVMLASADVVKVTYSGMPELDHSQKIRADGRISLPLIGEIRADGKTPGALQQELSTAYQKQLQNNNLVVTLENTSATAYVSGAVMKPGKVVIDRPMTVLEAIMEAGGFEPAFSNPRKVVLLRTTNGQQSSYKIDLSPALKGKPYAPLQVKPRDVIYVPQSFF